MTYIKEVSTESIADIETDKATMEWESFVEGEVLYIGVEEGDGVPVNDPVLILGEKGEDIIHSLFHSIPPSLVPLAS